jgi:hypothetical protein
MENFKTGTILGTGAAVNVSLGYVPDYVEVFNCTDGDKIFGWFRGKVIAFTSGGTHEIVAGETIVGATSGIEALVKEVLLSSGTWAGGDAAGFLLCNEDDMTGSFGSENVYVGTGTNDATVVAEVENGYDIDDAVAPVTSNGISSYVGTTALAKGFTIGTGVSEAAKLLRYVAFRNI